MNTFSKLALVATMALSLAACSQENEPRPRLDNFPADGVIRVAADVNQPQTRAGVTTDNLTDFYMVVFNPNSATYSYIAQMKKVDGEWKSYNAQDPLLPALTMLWQNKTTSISVAAFRVPESVKASESSDNPRLTVESDQSSEAALEKSDILLMPSKIVNPATDLTPEGKIKVELEHFLSKLNLILTLNTEFNHQPGGTANNVIEEVLICGTSIDVAWQVGKSTLGNPDLENNVFNGLQYAPEQDVRPFAAEFTPGSGTTTKAVAKYECILIPQSVPNHNIYVPQVTYYSVPLSVKIKIGGKYHLWESTGDVTFEKGKQYNLKLNVGKDVVTFGSFTIQDWGSGGTSDIETE